MFWNDIGSEGLKRLTKANWPILEYICIGILSLLIKMGIRLEIKVVSNFVKAMAESLVAINRWFFNNIGNCYIGNDGCENLSRCGLGLNF